MKQIDIYTEALICLRSILLADHPGVHLDKDTTPFPR